MRCQNSLKTLEKFETESCRVLNNTKAGQTLEYDVSDFGPEKKGVWQQQ